MRSGWVSQWTRQQDDFVGWCGDLLHPEDGGLGRRRWCFLNDPPAKQVSQPFVLEDYQMKRPKQLPAVDRNTVTRSAAVPAGAKVGPSGWQDWVKTIGGGVLSLL